MNDRFQYLRGVIPNKPTKVSASTSNVAYIPAKFSQIINTISAEQLEATHLTTVGTNLSNMLPGVEKFGTAEEVAKITNDLSLIEEKSKSPSTKPLEPKDSLQSIAYFARVIAKVHPGFESGLFDNTQFMSEIVKLYQSEQNNNPKMPQAVLLNELAKISDKTIPDNHLRIKGYEIRHPEKGNVEENIAHKDNITKDYKILAQEVLAGEKPEDASLLIAQKEINGKKVGIIAFDSCECDPTKPIHKQQWETILQSFRDNQESWDSVIIDVRGNGGGDNFQLKEIAETLYGDEVPYCMEAKYRDTPEASLQAFGFGRGSEQSKFEPKEFKGKDREIFILADRSVASAAEAIIPMLKPHPKSTVIGENSGGCCQFGGIVPIYMPDGTEIKVGSVLRTYENGFIEEKGHKPDINCSGENAFDKAIDLINNPDKPRRDRQTPIQTQIKER